MLRRTLAGFMCFVLFQLNAQVELTDSISLDLPVCDVIEFGTTLTFRPTTMTSSIAPCELPIAVEIYDPGDPIFVSIPVERIIITGADTVNGEFPLLFDRLGTYIFLCGVPDLPMQIPGVADQCFEVVEASPAAIPTIGEWGFIILGTLLLIIGVAYHRYTLRTDIKA